MEIMKLSKKKGKFIKKRRERMEKRNEIKKET
jgi:hypothetical protein